MKRTPFLLILILGIIGGALPLLPFIREVEWLTVDWRYRLRGPIETPKRVVVVAIDNAAERRWAGIPHAMWGSERAKILQRISDMGAEIVGLDLVIAVDTDAYLANRGGETPNTDFANVIAEMGPRIVLGTSTGNDWTDLFVFASNEQLASVNQGETIGTIVRSVPRRDIFMQPPLPSMATALSQTREQNPSPLWINYSGQNPISVPALDVLDGKVKSDQFKNAVVLIGETHRFTQDRYDTPFAQREAGVYIQAEAVETLLNHRELRFLPKWGECVVAALVAVGAGILALSAKPLRYVLVMLLLTSAGLVGCSFAFSSWNMVMPLFTPVLMGLLVSPAIAFPYRSYEEQGARAVMGQMMSENLFHRFQQGGAETGVLGSLVGGFLFLDIEDFSRKSNEMPADQFLEGLNRVLSEATTIIQDHGGDVITFVGDGLCAVYEAAPNETERSVKERAFRSGLELVDRIPVSVPGSVTWKVRVGIAWGEATVAVAGSSKRKQVSVYGSAVNLASRLEQAGKDLRTKMCVESAAFAEFAPDFDTGEVVVKGWDKPVAVRFRKGDG